jgi:hypothetical protein
MFAVEKNDLSFFATVMSLASRFFQLLLLSAGNLFVKHWPKCVSVVLWSFALLRTSCRNAFPTLKMEVLRFSESKVANPHTAPQPGITSSSSLSSP